MCEEKLNLTTINMFIEYASRKAFHIPHTMRTASLVFGWALGLICSVYECEHSARVRKEGDRECL